MKKLFIFIIITILTCFSVLLFYRVEFDMKKGEILFGSRKTDGNSYALFYKQGFVLSCIDPKGNGVAVWKMPKPSVSSAENIILPFKDGERLVYDVYSAGLKTGQSVLTFYGEKPFNDESAYYITFVTELPFFKDYEDIYAAKGSFLPIKINRKIEKIGGLSTEEIEEEYNQVDFHVTINKKGAFSTNKTTIQKNGPIYNAILLTYFCRANPGMEDKGEFRIVLPTQEFDIRISGEENIETPSGRYLADVFTSEPAKFTFYLSKDNERLPVKISSHTALNYTMILSSKENLD